jgi:hypothetical protein
MSTHSVWAGRVAWIVGFLLTCLPLWIRIWVQTRDGGAILDLNSYWDKHSDILFIAVAVGGVAMVECFEDLFNAGTQKDTTRFFGLLLAGLFLILGVGAALLLIGLAAKEPPESISDISRTLLLSSWWVVFLNGITAFALKWSR